MNKAFKLITILIITLISSLHADAPVWKVSNNSNHIYIAGTMHLLKEDDYPLKEEYKKAFINSDDIVFEADTSKTESLDVQKLMIEKGVYKDGKTIKDFLTPQTYNELKSYLKSKNLPPSVLYLKPGFLSVTIAAILYSEAGFNATGVDDFIEHQAKQNNKETFYLETLEEQMEFISNMGIGNEENVIKYTLEDIKKAHIQIPMIHKAWKNGDVNLANKIIVEFKSKYPKVYNTLVIQRNNNWLTKIEKMFNSKDVEYVLVGFLHLAGEDSVLLKLQNLGYKIEKLK